ncbi:MAG: Crp/Fnr family transcriptional regulator [Pseudomonadota bacterium]|jgi:CRP-like cAMP-binding protein|nr:Crp/Fnr family transcriptional regulator [Pseudomonadota bacterium]QKK06197.1 MAG: Crp/Fnr family transcriptional regulator [Pseudomonadota bacterium]
MQNIVSTLQKNPLFGGMPSPVLEGLARHCRIREFERLQDIFAMGDPADSFFIIADGWVKLYRTSREGEETIIHVFGPGESFAEAAVFSERNMYPVNAQAIEHALLVAVPRAAILHNIEEDSHFALNMLGTISARQRYLVQQLEQVTTRSAPQRIGAFLLRFCRMHPEGENGAMVASLPYNKSIIAARLNIQPETFSRALSKLAQHGVKTERQHIVIEDAEALEEFCDFSYDDIPCR